MDIDILLRSTQPVLYETSSEEFPYALAGTCYPVKYGETLFIVSAFHCYKNFGINPEQTLYSRPDDKRTFFAFDQQTRAQAERATDEEHYDQVVLRVAMSKHTQEEIDRVVALDLALPSNSRPPANSDLKDLIVHGYPFDAPQYGIDYDLKKITHQAYTTNGALGIGKAPYDFCYSIRMITPIPDGMHPNGMSGSPIYGITYTNNPVYCGTIIRYGSATGEYIVIGPEILVSNLKKI